MSGTTIPATDLIADPSIEFWLVWFITMFVMLGTGYRAGRHGACPHHLFWGSKGCIWKHITINKENDSE